MMWEGSGPAHKKQKLNDSELDSKGENPPTSMMEINPISLIPQASNRLSGSQKMTEYDRFVNYVESDEFTLFKDLNIQSFSQVFAVPYNDWEKKRQQENQSFSYTLEYNSHNSVPNILNGFLKKLEAKGICFKKGIYCKSRRDGMLNYFEISCSSLKHLEKILDLLKAYDSKSREPYLEKHGLDKKLEEFFQSDKGIGFLDSPELDSLLEKFKTSDKGKTALKENPFVHGTLDQDKEENRDCKAWLFRQLLPEEGRKVLVFDKKEHLELLRKFFKLLESECGFIKTNIVFNNRDGQIRLEFKGKDKQSQANYQYFIESFNQYLESREKLNRQPHSFLPRASEPSVLIEKFGFFGKESGFSNPDQEKDTNILNGPEQPNNLKI
jgi:hypothetical protein